MSSFGHPTTIAKSDIPPESHHQIIIPATLQSHGLQCHDQTPSSAERLLSQGQLNAEDFIETSPDIERTLMEAFIEDDYDGKLHLTTLSIKNEIVGMSFWREVPSEEMKDWMDLQRISKAIEDRKILASSPLAPSSATASGNDSDSDLSHNARDSMKLVRSDSMRWIQTALQPCQTQSKNHNDNIIRSSTINNNNEQLLPSTSTTTSASTIIHKLTHAWIKIELIAIKRTHRAHHLGNILLGCTLSKSHASLHHHNEHSHAILHIAGGGASKNVPAARLYARYGFVSVPEHEEGGPFTKPDRDLFVLGNIGMVLDALPWEEIMMQINSSGNGNAHDGIIAGKDVVNSISGGGGQRLIHQDQSGDDKNKEEDDNEKKAGKSCT